jgi:hypothetical protein
VKYGVKRADGPVALDGKWDGGQWKKAGVLACENYMGDKPEHFPKTQAKMLYDDVAVYVMFRVEDRYVRAVAGNQGPVCRDSCVEFFFVPDSTIENRIYFNVEMNCGGNMLFHWNSEPRKGKEIAETDCKEVEVYHSLAAKIDPEITEPTTWVAAYRLPIAVLEKYSAVARPGKGVVWRANFYKCADATSHPHWLTWAKVDKPRPDFHVPQFFDEIVFE